MRFPVFARWLVLCGAAVACVLTDQVQNDTWWQLRAGQEIWRGHLPLTDTWSYTAFGRHWPDHEWLWQAILYGLYHLGRLPLASAANLVVVLATLVLARPAGRPARADAYLLALAVPALSLGWSVRPQTVSVLLAVVVLRLLSAGRWWPVPLVMLLWANLHGAVAYGGLLLAASVVAAAWQWHRRRDAPSRRRLGAALATTMASALATLATPLGVGLWRYVANSSVSLPESSIEEWEPPWHVDISSATFWAWSIVVIGSVAIRSRRLLGWPAAVEVVASLMSFAIACSAVRNIPLFVAVSLVLLIRLWRPTAADDEPPSRRTPFVAALAGLAVVGVAVAAWSHPPADLGWEPMPSAVVRAVEQCPGHVYTGYNSGGIVLWWAPRVPVFVDSRHDPYPTRILRYAVLRPGDGHEAVLAALDVRCAALTPDDGASAAVLEKEGWTTSYAEGPWVVLARPDAVPAG